MRYRILAVGILSLGPLIGTATAMEPTLASGAEDTNYAIANILEAIASPFVEACQIDMTGVSHTPNMAAKPPTSGPVLASNPSTQRRYERRWRLARRAAPSDGSPRLYRGSPSVSQTETRLSIRRVEGSIPSRPWR